MGVAPVSSWEGIDVIAMSYLIIWAEGPSGYVGGKARLVETTF